METQPITDIKETVVNSTPQTVSIENESDKGSNETINTQQKTSESVFNRSIVEANTEQIRLSDHDDENNLDLFSYVNCNSEDDRTVQKCRGVVFKGNDIVLEGFPFTPEYNHTENENISKVIPDFSNCRFFESYEGALIRVFWFNNKWYLSTHRKLDAFRSKWASKESFGSIFERALNEEEHNDSFKQSLPDEGESIIERFCSILNKDHQYMFHVRNITENRIVCLASDIPKVYHVGTFIDGKLDLDDNVGIEHPSEKKEIRNVEELCSHVNKMDVKNHQGIIVFCPKNTQIKILNKEYQDLFRVRANVPSIKFRYLQVRMNQRLTNGLYTLYPEFGNEFDEYENILYKIAQYIHRSYIARHVHHKHVRVPVKEYKVIRTCHDWHCSDRPNNRVNENKVIDVLNEQTPSDLNHMIRSYKIDSAKQKEEHSKRQHVTPKFTGVTPQNTPVDNEETQNNINVSPMLLPQPVKNE